MATPNGKESTEDESKKVPVPFTFMEGPPKIDVITKERIAELGAEHGFTGEDLLPCFGCQHFEDKDGCKWFAWKTKAITQGLKYDTKYAKRALTLTQRWHKVRLPLCDLCIHEKYRHLGEGNREPLPMCIEAEIKNAVPDPVKKFTGFMLAKVNRK